MERLDANACEDLSKLLDTSPAMFLAKTCSADIISGILRSLSWLVTSRYHAAVLSMPAAVPITAISMDERLDGLLGELSLDKEFLHHVLDRDLNKKIYQSLKKQKMDQSDIIHIINENYPLYQEKLANMGDFLKQYILTH